MLRKSLNLFLMATLTISLGACSSDEASSDTTNSSTDQAVQDESSGNQEVHWSYEGETGPEHWAELDSANALCINGTEQSPINIDSAKTLKEENVKKVQINYESSTSVSIMNNGHTVQANLLDENNRIILDGTEYKLSQFHFHTPSEHQFDGENYNMELHLVHTDKDGNIAVLGLMIKEGSENKDLASIWNVIPEEETDADVPVNDPINLNNFLPEDQSAYYYDGSLTTPPCTESVKWTVFKEPIEMSKQQIEIFQNIFHDNHRAVQTLNGREVKSY